MSKRLIKFKTDDTYAVILYEMTESLIFNKIYSFIYFNIKQFNYEEEQQLKLKLQNAKSDFTFSKYQVDTIYNECQFISAIQEIKKLPLLSSPFEKIVY